MTTSSRGAVEVVAQELALPQLDHQRTALLVGEEALGEVAEAVQVARVTDPCHDAAAPQLLSPRKESKMAKERSKTAGDKLRDRISEAKSRFQGRTPRTRTRKRPQARGSTRGRLRRK
jgi:glycerol-3-phosphate O-acyltransferase